jgi:glutamate racemase
LEDDARGAKSLGTIDETLPQPLSRLDRDASKIDKRSVIGVYDSGFGGLTVLRHLRRTLPERDFLYLGDTGRAPYGGRDANTLLDFAEQCVERLFEEGCRLVIVACNTVSCVALRHLQRRYASPGSARRILGVSIPAAEVAVATSAGHIGVIATHRTVASGTFAVEIAKLGPHIVTQRAAPLLAPLVEEGWENTEIARLTVLRYLEGFGDIDTLLLGCTHYPLLLPAFEAATKVRVLDPAPFVAERLAAWLERHPGFDATGDGALRVLCTGDPSYFRAHAPRFLGEELNEVGHVAEEGGRLAHRPTMQIVKGQVLR